MFGNDINPIDEFSSKWVEVISYIHKKFSNHRIVIKFHPESEDNEEFIKIKDNLKIQMLNFLGKKTSILQYLPFADIIIGELSTVLIWASLYKNKNVQYKYLWF